MHNIPLAKHDISQADKDAVMHVLSSSHLSMGPAVSTFEQELAAFTGMRYAVTCNSGTSALHLILLALGIGPGDEVITTPYSFIASANCILFVGATPRFVDINPLTYNIDPKKVAEAVNEKTKAILSVDVFGRLAPLDALADIASKHNIALIDDCCEALGTKGIAQKSDAGAFGFYPNKQITCGEGGAIVTNSEHIALMAKSQRNQGRDIGDSHLSHSQLGYNFRLSDISCALLSSQLKRLPEMTAKKNALIDVYKEELKNTPLRLPMTEETQTLTNWFVFVIELPPKASGFHKAEMVSRLRRLGIGAGNYFTSIHLQPLYKKRFSYKEGDFQQCEYVADRTVALPFFTAMTKKQVKIVCDEVKNILSVLELST